MKKKTRANVIMVIIICAIMAAGILSAVYIRDRDSIEGTKPSASQNSQVPSTSAQLSVPAATTAPKPTLPDADGYVTISILCSTILDNMNDLADGKAEFVPEDGAILSAIEVPFYEGETVFDVLKRVCQFCEVQLEFSWSPIYDSYYVEGINHLYEFDCGMESGWIYRVNGQTPNYGCSAYTLTEGDEILWAYTCHGWGADVE